MAISTPCACFGPRCLSWTWSNPQVKSGSIQEIKAQGNSLTCGTTRIASVSVSDPLVSYSGSWHQDVAHHWNDAGGQALLVAHNRAAFQAAFLDLARKLDVEEANGRTFLDNTLISWSQESGFNTHESCGTPLVTAGSAGGYFKTGTFFNYRNTGRI